VKTLGEHIENLRNIIKNMWEHTQKKGGGLMREIKVIET